MGHVKPNLVVHDPHVARFNHLIPCTYFVCMDYIMMTIHDNIVGLVR